MSFSVNTNALPGLAALMDRRWQNLQDGYDYLHRYTQIGWTQVGILNWLFGEHQQVVEEVGSFLKRAANDYAGPYSTAIIRANQYYAHTDTRVAARVDATLPRSDDPGKHDEGTPQASQGVGPDVFGDPPTSGMERWDPPPDHQAEYSYDFMLPDALSPTSDVRELIWQVTGLAVKLGLLDHPFDPIDEAAKPLSGDWTAFAACADVYRNLAQMLVNQGAALFYGMGEIPLVWTGNAADACAVGLGQFAGQLRAAVGPLEQTADAYVKTADGIRAQAELLASLFTILVDEVIESAINAATDGMFAQEQLMTTIEDVVRIVYRARKAIGIAWEIAKQFVESGGVTMATLGIIANDHPLPGFTGKVPDLPSLPGAHPVLD